MHNIHLFTYRLSVSFLIGLCVAICACQSPEQNLPNVIIVLADDLGYGDISSFNPNGKIPTPHIDAIGRAGIRCTDAHSPSAVCTPTRYGLLTGRYSWRTHLKNGVLTGTSGPLIAPDRLTIAEMLKNQGYTTGFIGKWHLGWTWSVIDSSVKHGSGWNAEDFGNIDFNGPVTQGPQDVGFDYSFGHAASLDIAPYVYVENGEITEAPDGITVDTGKYTWWREGPTGADFDHHDVTPNFFRKSIDFISRKSKSSSPFFLYLALPSPHTPILPTGIWQDTSRINPYADFVMMIDHYMGELDKSLEDAGIIENTLVVFTSDNGCSPEADFEILASFNHHPGHIFRGHKADIYEGGHRVPFVARWPNQITKESIIDKTISLTDLMATLAEISDYSIINGQGEDSYSLMPLFKGQPEEFSRKNTIHHSINGSFAIRQDQYKLILCPGSGGWSDPRPGSDLEVDLPRFQLYDLETDPGETKNIIDDHSELANEMIQLLTRQIESGRSTPGQEQSNDLYSGQWSQIDFFNE